MQIPEFVSAVLKTFDELKEPFNEVQIVDELQKASKSQPEMNPDELKGYIAEANAFFFIPAHNENNPWGTYFGPFMTGTRQDGTEAYSPDIAQIDSEILGYWEKRATETPNPVLRARYSDLLWDLTRHVTGTSPNHEYARRAIDSYLEATKAGLYTLPIRGIHWCERALGLARMLSDHVRINQVVDFMFKFYDAVSIPERMGTCFFLFDNLYGNDKLVNADQEKRIITNLEELLGTVSVYGKRTFDPWGAQGASERLEKHYRRIGSEEDARRVVRAYGMAFESVAAEANPTLALAWLQPVIEKYQHTSLKEDMERAQHLSARKGENINADMKSVSSTVTFSKEEIDNYLEIITKGDLREALIRITANFIPDSSDARDTLRALKTEFPLQALIGVQKIADGQIVGKAGSVDEDEEGRLHMQIDQNIAVSNMFLVLAFQSLMDRLSPTPEQIIECLFESPVFEESSRQILKEGLAGYGEGDFVKTIHVLIPQIERTLRNLLALLGIPTSKHVRGTMQMKNINNILADEQVRSSLGENVWRYLFVLLADSRGLNLRNRMAHGLLDYSEFNQTTALRVIHAILTLSLIRSTSEPSPAETTPPA